MKNKKECEIVQDLLVNYADGILNSESQKLVEAHLVNCEDCQNRLLQIKEDVKKSDNKEQIELDYLRKIRIKSKVKSIIMTLVFLFIIFFIYYIIKFVKINDIINKSAKFSNSNNYYTEQITTSYNTACGIKTYYKDGKYKQVMESYDDNGVEKFMEMYGSTNSDERITIDYRNNIATMEKGEFAEIMNKNQIFNKENKQNLFSTIQKTFTTSITTDNYYIGKEYYIIKDIFNNHGRFETWVDKETGLVIRRISRDSDITYYPGTDVRKNVSDRIEDCKYEFGNVTDEDVKVPDLSNYKIENRYTNIEDLVDNAK